MCSSGYSAMNLFTSLITGIKECTFHMKGNTKTDRPDKILLDYFGKDISLLPENNAYLYSAWVNIAVSILIRNIAWADFVLLRGGNDVPSGPLYELFRRPNRLMSRFDLWKETAAWWAGPDYSGGIPKELFVLDPRHLRNEGHNMGDLAGVFRGTNRRWFYDPGTESIPILSDELIQFRDWNL
jgi:hypothetical protein